MFFCTNCSGRLTAVCKLCVCASCSAGGNLETRLVDLHRVDFGGDGLACVSQVSFAAIWETC